MASLFWGVSKLDEDVDKATAETLPSGGENLELNFEISDRIRSGSVGAKEAMRSIKRRLNQKNPNVQLLALTLTDTCVKNSGDKFLAEIASREFMDNLVSIIKVPTVNHDVKQQILRLVQNWALALESKPAFSYPGETYRTLKKEGFTFPPQDATSVSAAMVDTLTPPEWIDSDVCLRCRTPFSFTNRKHHCRNCGRVIDQQCSTKTLPLPYLGINQAVRVCDICHPSLISKSKADESHHARKSSISKHQRTGSSSTRYKSARELADEELQRAIQLSLEEAGLTYSSREPEHGPRRVGYVPPAFEPPLVESQRNAKSVQAEEEDDPDLKAAIEASLREANAPKPSAPIVDSLAEQRDWTSLPLAYQPTAPAVEPIPSYDLDASESDAILTFNQTVENAQVYGPGRLVRDHGAAELYRRATGVTPKLSMSLDDAGRKEQLLSEMNYKLSEAAKLYDQLLSAQASNPARQQAASSPYYSPYQPQSYASPPLAAPPLNSSYGPGPSYVPPPPQTYQPYQPWPQSAPALPQQASPSPAAPSSYHPQQPYTAPIQSQTTGASVGPYQQSAPTSQWTGQSSYGDPNRVTSPVPIQTPYSTQPASLAVPPPESYAQPTYEVSPTASYPGYQPPHLQQQVPQSPVVQQQHAPPVSVPPMGSSAPPLEHQPPVHEPASTAPPAPLQSPAPQASYQSPPQSYAPAAPAPYQTLPVFPTAPTAPLQSYEYETPKPKEAMLISFD